MAAQYLVLFDANRIKDYVFATGRLKEIRGASAIVRSATELSALHHVARSALRRDLSDDEVIYVGGAAGALVVESEAEARAFMAALARHYRRATRGATLSAVYAPILDAADNSSVAAAQKQASRELASAKAATPRAEAIAGGGYIRFCASDRLYPASQYDDDPDIPEQLLFYSASSKHKRDVGSNERGEYAGSGHPFWKQFISQVVGDQKDELAWWERAAAHSNSQDLGDIGGQSQPDDYIALVYMDGDGIGKRIRETVQQHGLPGYRAISRALTLSATIAAADALAIAYKGWPRHKQAGRALPFEIITIGGDDVLLVCTGDAGLQVAVTLAKQFSAEMNGRGYANVSASVGVVIAHSSHPIVNMRDRAGELLKSAKRSVSNGGVDFHIVSTPGLEPIGRVRQEQYASAQGLYSDALVYTRRPYSIDHMVTLIGQAGYIAQLPGNKRSELYDACLRNQHYHALVLEVLRIQSRLRTKDQAALLAALRELGVGVRYPFVRNPDKRRDETPLIDLLEVAEFVPVAPSVGGE